MLKEVANTDHLEGALSKYPGDHEGPDKGEDQIEPGGVEEDMFIKKVYCQVRLMQNTREPVLVWLLYLCDDYYQEYRQETGKVDRRWTKVVLAVLNHLIFDCKVSLLVKSVEELGLRESLKSMAKGNNLAKLANLAFGNYIGEIASTYEQKLVPSKLFCAPLSMERIKKVLDASLADHLYFNHHNIGICNSILLYYICYTLILDQEKEVLEVTGDFSGNNIEGYSRRIEVNKNIWELLLMLKRSEEKARVRLWESILGCAEAVIERWKRQLEGVGQKDFPLKIMRGLIDQSYSNQKKQWVESVTKDQKGLIFKYEFRDVETTTIGELNQSLETLDDILSNWQYLLHESLESHQEFIKILTERVTKLVKDLNDDSSKIDSIKIIVRAIAPENPEKPYSSFRKSFLPVLCDDLCTASSDLMLHILNCLIDWPTPVKKVIVDHFNSIVPSPTADYSDISKPWKTENKTLLKIHECLCKYARDEQARQKSMKIINQLASTVMFIERIKLSTELAEECKQRGIRLNLVADWATMDPKKINDIKSGLYTFKDCLADFENSINDITQALKQCNMNCKAFCDLYNQNHSKLKDCSEAQKLIVAQKQTFDSEFETYLKSKECRVSNLTDLSSSQVGQIEIQKQVLDRVSAISNFDDQLLQTLLNKHPNLIYGIEFKDLYSCSYEYSIGREQELVTLIKNLSIDKECTSMIINRQKFIYLKEKLKSLETNLDSIDIEEDKKNTFEEYYSLDPMDIANVNDIRSLLYNNGSGQSIDSCLHNLLTATFAFPKLFELFKLLSDDILVKLLEGYKNYKIQNEGKKDMSKELKLLDEIYQSMEECKCSKYQVCMRLLSYLLPIEDFLRSQPVKVQQDEKFKEVNKQIETRIKNIETIIDSNLDLQRQLTGYIVTSDTTKGILLTLKEKGIMFRLSDTIEYKSIDQKDWYPISDLQNAKEDPFLKSILESAQKLFEAFKHVRFLSSIYHVPQQFKEFVTKEDKTSRLEITLQVKKGKKDSTNVSISNEKEFIQFVELFCKEKESISTDLKTAIQEFSNNNEDSFKKLLTAALGVEKSKFELEPVIDKIKIHRLEFANKLTSKLIDSDYQPKFHSSKKSLNLKDNYFEAVKILKDCLVESEASTNMSDSKSPILSASTSKSLELDDWFNVEGNYINFRLENYSNLQEFRSLFSMVYYIQYCSNYSEKDLVLFCNSKTTDKDIRNSIQEWKSLKRFPLYIFDLHRLQPQVKIKCIDQINAISADNGLRQIVTGKLVATRIVEEVETKGTKSENRNNVSLSKIMEKLKRKNQSTPQKTASSALLTKVLVHSKVSGVGKSTYIQKNYNPDSYLSIYGRLETNSIYDQINKVVKSERIHIDLENIEDYDTYSDMLNKLLFDILMYSLYYTESNGGLVPLTQLKSVVIEISSNRKDELLKNIPILAILSSADIKFCQIIELTNKSLIKEIDQELLGKNQRVYKALKENKEHERLYGVIVNDGHKCKYLSKSETLFKDYFTVRDYKKLIQMRMVFGSARLNNEVLVQDYLMDIMAYLLGEVATYYKSSKEGSSSDKTGSRFFEFVKQRKFIYVPYKEGDKIIAKEIQLVDKDCKEEYLINTNDFRINTIEGLDGAYKSKLILIISKMTGEDAHDIRNRVELSKEANNYVITCSIFVKILVICSFFKATEVAWILRGESGCGKTTLIEVISALMNANFGLSDKKNIVKIHPGLSPQDIENRVEQCIQKEANDSRSIVLLFDEFNTSPYQSYILRILLDRVYSDNNTEKVLPDNVITYAACNPYKLNEKPSDNSLELSHKVEQTNLKALGLTLEFDQYTKFTFQLIFQNLVESKLKDKDLIKLFKGNNRKELFESFIELFEDLRMDDNSSLSLRDLKRILRAYEQYFNSFKQVLKDLADDSLMELAFYTAVNVCIVYRFNDKIFIDEEEEEESEEMSDSQNESEVAEKVNSIQKRKDFWSNTIRDYTLNALGRFQNNNFRIIEEDQNSILDFLPTLILELSQHIRDKNKSNIDKNAEVETDTEILIHTTSLKQNILAILTAILTRNHCFIYGEAGSSKTIAFKILLKEIPEYLNKHGDKDLTENFNPIIGILRELKNLYVTTYAASQSSRANQIDTFFEAVLKREENKIKVALVEELGLAEQSSNNALKSLNHYLEELQHNGIVFIGLSNTPLDMSKMNRTIVVHRNFHLKLISEIFTPHSLCQDEEYKNFMEMCAEAYVQWHKYLRFKKIECINELRDMHSLKKRLATLENKSDRNERVSILNKAIIESLSGQSCNYTDTNGIGRNQNIKKLMKEISKKSKESYYTDYMQILSKIYVSKYIHLQDPECFSEDISQTYKRFLLNQPGICNYLFGQEYPEVDNELFVKFIYKPTVQEILKDNLKDNYARFPMIIYESYDTITFVVDLIQEYYGSVDNKSTQEVEVIPSNDDTAEDHQSLLGEVKNKVVTNVTLIIKDNEVFKDATYDLANWKGKLFMQAIKSFLCNLYLQDNFIQAKVSSELKLVFIWALSKLQASQNDKKCGTSKNDKAFLSRFQKILARLSDFLRPEDMPHLIDMRNRIYMNSSKNGSKIIPCLNMSLVLSILFTFKKDSYTQSEKKEVDEKLKMLTPGSFSTEEKVREFLNIKGERKFILTSQQLPESLDLLINCQDTKSKSEPNKIACLSRSDDLSQSIKEFQLKMASRLKTLAPSKSNPFAKEDKNDIGVVFYSDLSNKRDVEVLKYVVELVNRFFTTQFLWIIRLPTNWKELNSEVPEFQIGFWKQWNGIYTDNLQAVEKYLLEK